MARCDTDTFGIYALGQFQYSISSPMTAGYSEQDAPANVESNTLKPMLVITPGGLDITLTSEVNGTTSRQWLDANGAIYASGNSRLFLRKAV